MVQYRVSYIQILGYIPFSTIEIWKAWLSESFLLTVCHYWTVERPTLCLLQ